MKTTQPKNRRITFAFAAPMAAAGLTLPAMADDRPATEPLEESQTKADTLTEEQAQPKTGLPENEAVIDPGRDAKPLTSAQTKARNRTENASPEALTIRKVASSHTDTTTFHKLVEAADMGDFMAEADDLTVLVPSDAAFDRLPEGKVDHLMEAENLAELRALIKNHIVRGHVLRAADVGEDVRVQTYAGETINIGTSADKVVVDNRATVVTPDVAATNGIIHVIDHILVPSGTQGVAARADE